MKIDPKSTFETLQKFPVDSGYAEKPNGSEKSISFKVPNGNKGVVVSLRSSFDGVTVTARHPLQPEKAMIAHQVAEYLKKKGRSVPVMFLGVETAEHARIGNFRIG